MFPRLEGELVKIIKVENGWNVVVWAPEAPKPTLPGETPCSQQPMKWWKTYVFQTTTEVNAFSATFIENADEKV